jgi:hypothetical protein
MKSLLAAVLLGACAKPPALDTVMDAGASQPTVQDVEPRPGAVPSGARFTVRFSTSMDEGQLLAASGRSESVVLALAEDVERAAAAIEHAPLSAHERTLLLPAAADVAADRRSISLTPDRALAPGGYFLLVSPRLKDDLGRRLAGNGARFAFQAVPSLPTAKLQFPPAGGESPWNLQVVRASAPGGRVAVLGPHGEELAAVDDAHGSVELRLAAPLAAGSEYSLALDGSALAEQTFTAAPCARNAPPALQGAGADLAVRDTGVTASLVLDWPAQIEISIEDSRGAAVTAASQILCAPPPCGPQSFACAGSIRIDGLRPASDYTLSVTARDDFGFVLRAARQPFSTVAALPRALVSEVMASGVDGEYVEVFNLGPGAADLEALALQGNDGIVRPLLATAPPLATILAPGSRALAVGASFDPALYPAIPAGTPVLRASTQRLLGRGLSDDAPPPFRLLAITAAAVELAEFPGADQHCPAGASLQRDEAAPPESPGIWSCGRVGGTPGRPP